MYTLQKNLVIFGYLYFQNKKRLEKKVRHHHQINKMRNKKYDAKKIL